MWLPEAEHSGLSFVREPCIQSIFWALNLPQMQQYQSVCAIHMALWLSLRRFDPMAIDIDGISGQYNVVLPILPELGG